MPAIQRLRRTRNFWALGLLTLALVAWAAPAAASALGDAKASGQVGERYDGYLGVVKSSVAGKALAADINVKRKAHYSKIAAKNGATVETTAAVAGSKLVKSASSGQYVMPAAGASWRHVP